MPKFTLEFETGNAAFGETRGERREEIARILRTVADRLTRTYSTGDDCGPIRDANGNRVGSYQMPEG